MSDPNHCVTDLAVHLAAPLTESEPVVVTGLGDVAAGTGGAWSLVRLSPSSRWSGATASLGSTLLVLEGAATVKVDDWRYSAASGHLIGVGAGSQLSIYNDGPGEFSALLREELGGSSAVASDGATTAVAHGAAQGPTNTPID